VSEAARVVLDTNVLLTLFVFADSRYAPLRERLERGKLTAFTDERCLAEYRRVLAYPMFSLNAAAQAAAYDAYARLIEVVSAAPEPIELPECKDPDDQKFLEVARDGRAQWLITSDKALLKLARRRKLAHLFSIVTPARALEIGGARLAAGFGEGAVEEGVRH
jgi:putative PIN family toxin of toxin-antitoxin system